MRAPGWMPDGTKARLYYTLRLAHPIGLTTPELQRLLGGGRKAVENQLAVLSTERWVGQTKPGQPWKVLDPERKPPIACPGMGLAEAVNYTLEERAFEALRRQLAGMDSQALAELLGCTADEVERAIERSPCRYALVSCTVLRQGQRLVLYRLSAGGVRANSWTDQRDNSFQNYRARVSQAYGAGAEL